MNKKCFITIGFLFLLIFPLLGESKLVRMGYIDSSPNFMRGESELDSKSGYGYEYLIQIASYTEWKYLYSYNSWTNLYEQLLEGKIDILIDVPKSMDNYRLLFSEQPIGVENYNLFINSDKTNIDTSLDSLNGKTIGVFSKNVSPDYLYEWLEKNNLDVNLKIYQDKEKYLRDFISGTLDFIFDTDIKNKLPVVSFATIKTEEYYIAVNSSKSELKKEIDAAMEEMDLELPEYKDHLMTKYYIRDAASKPLFLYDTEWIETHKILKVGCLQNYLPYCGMDIATGSVVGIFPELMRKILADHNLQDKIKLQFVCYETEEDGILAVDNNEVDVFYPTYYSSWHAEMYNWYQTIPISQATVKIVFKGQMDASKYNRIAVAANTPDYYYVRIILPDSEVVIYKTVEEALDAVRKGNVDSAAVNGYMLLKTMQNLKRYSSLSIQDISKGCNYSAILDKNNKSLYHFLNRAIYSINDEFYGDTKAYYVSEVIKYTGENFIKDNGPVIAILLVLFVFTLLALFYFVRKLRSYSDYDALTLLLSERKLKPILKGAINHALMSDNHFCLVVASVNEFTSLTNTYGNACGDEILKYMASVFLRGVKRDDFVFRYKENKIVVILNTTLPVAENVMNRIVSEIENETFIFKDTETKITVATGYSYYAAGATSKMMMDEAEQKLSK